MNTGLLKLAAFFLDGAAVISQGAVAVTVMMSQLETQFYMESPEPWENEYESFISKRIRLYEELWLEYGKPTKILMQCDDNIAHWASLHPEVELWFYDSKYNQYTSGEQVHHVDPSCIRIPMVQVYDPLEDDDLPF